MGEVIASQNQLCELDQSLMWFADLFIDYPGGYIAKPVFYDFTSALRRKKNSTYIDKK